MSTPCETTVPRSTFVSVLAWIFIVMSGFTTLIGILQNVMIQTMFQDRKMDAARAAALSDPHVPAFAAFMFAHFEWIFLGFLIVSATTLVASVGLLKRLDWARWLFIVLMGLGIAWQLLGMVLQVTMFSSFPGPMADAPVDMQAQFQGMYIGIMVVSAIMALAMSALFAWIIKRLLSPAIASEFRGTH